MHARTRENGHPCPSSWQVSSREPIFARARACISPESPKLDTTRSLSKCYTKVNKLTAFFHCLFNKLRSVFYVSVLLLHINYVITLSKLLWIQGPQASGSTATLTMLWRNLCAVRGQTHKKLTSICFLR